MRRALLFSPSHWRRPCLAQAAGFDAPGLARFDTGYASLRRRASAHMKGARDEAYLAVYRVKADAKARARFAELRRSAAYRKEQRAAQAAPGPPNPPASIPAPASSSARRCGRRCSARSTAKG